MNEQAKHHLPVLRFDMSGLRAYTTSVMGLEDFTLLNDLYVPTNTTSGGMLLRVIHKLYKTQGQVVVLIDKYDKPILDNLTDERYARSSAFFLYDAEEL